MRFALVLCLCSSLAFSQDLQPDLLHQACQELFADRYEQAAGLYRQVLAQAPSGEAYYGLTRALLSSHKAKDAYAVAEEALARAPQTPGAQTAAGLAAFRRGELSHSEDFFHAALKLDPQYAGAFSGLATVNSAIAFDKTSRDYVEKGYKLAPDDPELLTAHVNSLKGDEHIAALERALASLDPQSDEARSLRAHIASDRALRGRVVRRLASPYAETKVALTVIPRGLHDIRGFGLRVRFNQKYTATLLLDTGASGISVSPKLADKAGLELLSGESVDSRGIGDKTADPSLTYLAPSVDIGKVSFADVPVHAFRSAKDTDIEGLIGTDVFRSFLVALDFRGREMVLYPYPSPFKPTDDELFDAHDTAQGFSRVLRLGTHLFIATSINAKATRWFLIDSGSSSNLMDTEAAREFTKVRGDSSLDVRGIQGKVDKVSRADYVSLTFGGFRQDNPDLISISLERASDDFGFAIAGVIGMPILSQLRVTLDYRGGAIKFERPH